jgi:hypothetical protein
MLELLLVALVAVILIAVIPKLFTNGLSFYRRTQARAQVILESRACMDTLLNRLRSGKSKTLVISTPASASSPNSMVVFDLLAPLPSGATFYTFYLANGTVYAQEGSQQAPKPLATHVTGLMFTGNSSDSAIIYVTLRIDAPFDASNDPAHVATFIIPNQVVHMVESQ